MTRFAQVLLTVMSLNAVAMTVQDGQFSIELPEGAQVQDTREKTSSGDVVGKTWEAELGDDFLSFTYSDHPKDIANALTAKEHLKNAVDGSLSGSKAKSLKQTPFVVKLNGVPFPGMEIESAAPGVLLHSRFMMVGPRLYTLVFGRSDASHSLEPFTHAKDTFRLLSGKDPFEPVVVDQPGFSIVMPFNTTDGATEASEGLRAGHSWEAEVNETFLSFSDAEMKTAPNAAQIPGLLKNMAAGSVKNTKGRVLKQTNLQLRAGNKTATALDLEAKTSEGIIFMTRFIVSGTHVYTLIYARPEHEPSVKMFEAAARSLILK